MPDKTFKEYMTEAKGNKIYVDAYDNLWIAYDIGSGQTLYRVSRKSYITNARQDANYHPFADKIFEWSLQNKPLKKNNNSKLFELGVYDKDKDPFKGDQPQKKFYMNVNKTEHLVVITFFDSKNEAIGWIKHSN